MIPFPRIQTMRRSDRMDRTRFVRDDPDNPFDVSVRTDASLHHQTAAVGGSHDGGNPFTPALQDASASEQLALESTAHGMVPSEITTPRLSVAAHETVGEILPSPVPTPSASRHRYPNLPVPVPPSATTPTRHRRSRTRTTSAPTATETIPTPSTTPHSKRRIPFNSSMDADPQIRESRERYQQCMESMSLNLFGTTDLSRIDDPYRFDGRSNAPSFPLQRKRKHPAPYTIHRHASATISETVDACQNDDEHFDCTTTPAADLVTSRTVQRLYEDDTALPAARVNPTCHDDADVKSEERCSISETDSGTDEDDDTFTQPNQPKTPNRLHQKSMHKTPVSMSNTHKVGSIRHARQMHELRRIMTTPTKRYPFPRLNVGYGDLDASGWTSPDSMNTNPLFDWIHGKALMRGEIGASKQRLRTVIKDPIRVLDAPGARDDYYTNLLDWGKKDTLCVGLDDTCYIWNPKDGSVHELTRVDRPDYVSVTVFSADGRLVAVGSELGQVKALDSGGGVVCGWQSEHGVAAMGWVDAHVCLVGDRRGSALLWDIRAKRPNPGLVRQTNVDEWGLSPPSSSPIQERIYNQGLNAADRGFVNLDRGAVRMLDGVHDDRVVSVAVHPLERTRVATGCNGHLVRVWDLRRSDKSVLAIRHFQSAVRGLGWCPVDRDVLVGGGGIEDGRVCVLDVACGGSCRATIETGEQVTAVVWSAHGGEFATLHAGQKQIVVWAHPHLREVASMSGHQKRPLHAAACPDGRTLATMAGDETIKVRNCI